MSRGQYLYATGRIRSLENKMLSTGDVGRMVDAKDAGAAFKVFNDLSYADELADIEDPKEYNAVLNHDLMQVKEVLRQITPDKNLLDLLFLEYDFHNIKLFFKSKYLQKELSDYESQLGNIDAARLKDFVSKDVTTGIPEEVVKIVRDAAKMFDKEKNGFVIDSYLDYRYFELIKDIVKKTSGTFVKNLVTTWIDIANVKLFLRAKRMDLDLEKIKDYFIDGGNILKSSLINYYGKDIKDAITVCSRGFSDQEVKDEIKNYAEGGKMWKLEKAFENLEISYIKDAKYIAYGPEVIITYYIAKKNAVKNIRLIFTGKVNELSGSEIKERIRDLYYSHVKYKV